MDKKYQVFISSTYADMKAERQAAVEAILDAGHIPVGMELFAASDRTALEVIKKWIDESDIFMLILGGRYGSVELESSKSYIQLEYEHAVNTSKPFFALYLTKKAIDEKVKLLGTDAIEQNDTKKLNDFRALVKSKLCSEIEDVKDIHRNVPKSIKRLEESHKLGGWVRASNVPDLSPLKAKMQELQMKNAHLDVVQVQNVQLREENLRLEEQLRKAKMDAERHPAPLLPQFTGNFSESSLDAQLQLHISVLMSGDIEPGHRAWDATYRIMFSLIGAKLLEEPADKSVHAYVQNMLRELTPHSSHVSVSEASFQKMKMKFVALGVVDLTKRDSAVRWSLTDNGKILLVKLHEEQA